MLTRRLRASRAIPALLAFVVACAPTVVRADGQTEAAFLTKFGGAVNARNATSGQVLGWDATAKAWKPITLPGGGGFAAQTANTALRGPASGAAALPTFRTAVPADLAAGGVNTNVLTITGGVLAWGSGGSTYPVAPTTGTATAGGANSIVVGPTATDAGNSGASVFGTEADAGGANDTAVGYRASAGGGGFSNNTAVGRSAVTQNVGASAFGASATVTGSRGTALGIGATVSHTNSVAVGADATSTAANQFLFGSSGETITTFVCGNGTTATCDLGATGNVFKDTYTRTVKLTGSTSGVTTLSAGATPTSRTYTWPSDFGAAGSVLTDAAGNGTLSWAAAAGGSYPVAPASGTATATAGTHRFAAGPSSSAGSNNATTIGDTATVGASSASSTALGYLSTITATLSANTALGSNSYIHGSTTASTAVGYGASIGASSCVGIGHGVAVSDDESGSGRNVAIGAGGAYVAGSSDSVAVGYAASVPNGCTGSIALGSGSQATAGNQFIFGSSGQTVTSFVCGNGTTGTCDLGATGNGFKNAFLASAINTTAGDAATINAAAGRFRKDTSGATFVLTSSAITTDAIVILTPVQVDVSALTWGVVNNNDGTATITFNAAPTANYDMNFWVISK